MSINWKKNKDKNPIDPTLENLNLPGKRRMSRLTPFLCAVALLWLFSQNALAGPPLMTLELESVIVDWQDEFVLTLSIYGPEDMELPPVTVDGLDQFQLQGTGKNLLQIPRGKTKRWILTYTMVASDTGNFKIGPAIVTHNGRSYRSNIVFLTVEPPRIARRPQAVQPQEQKKPATPEPPKKEPQKPPVKPTQREKRPPVQPPAEEKRQPVEEPKPAPKEIIKPPVVMSSAQIGDRIVILMETAKSKPYQLEGIPVTVRLLSQLPVENLQFLEEADFPGFLRYDFPFTSKPKGEVVTYRNRNYASYELVRFLLFPLEGGQIQIPPVRCELKVRVPSGAFPEADLRLNLQRTSNILDMEVLPSPEGAVVGDFVLRNEIVSDEPDSKILRMILEGKGQLSTFDFPEITGSGFVARSLGVSTKTKVEGEHLISKKTQELEILPAKTTTTIVLPEIRVSEFNPERKSLNPLLLPPMSFHFEPPGAAPQVRIAFPTFTNRPVWVLYMALGLFTIFVYFRNYRPSRPRTRLRLRKLFSNKNLNLQISKSAARTLYQQIAMQIGLQEGETYSIQESVTRHLPREEWLNVTRGLRKLEHTAYSATKSAPVTYGEMRKLCEKIEGLWVH